jgi:hypothetical protein
MKSPSALALLLALTWTASAQESRIELHSHFSALLGTAKSFNIFLPEGYDHDSLHYPAVYLFRGHEREWANPTEDASRRGNIKTVADKLTSSGAIGKMILVMPGLSQPGTAEDFAYVSDELIPYIDSHFRTVPVRQKRGMDGFSYGGFDELQLLRRSPELFYTMGAYDGSFWVVDLGSFFAATTEAYWDLLRPMKFLIHSTPAGNYASNQQFLSILKSHGIDNGFDSLKVAPSSSHNWYYADLHMEQSLPLHWRHLLAGSQVLTARLVSPLAATTVSGDVRVQWSLQPRPSNLRTAIEYSRNRGFTWQELYATTDNDTSFLWDTRPFQDGTGYLLRVRALGDTSSGFAQMGGYFTLNNPGNALPEVGVLFPDSAVVLSGEQIIQWWADDADGDSLVISIDASADNGVTWSRLADVPNTGMYLWHTSAAPNSSTCRIRIRGTDAASSGEAISSPFALLNQRQSLRPALVEHLTGHADGDVAVHVVDSLLLTGHRYRVLFEDSVPGVKTYSIVDVDRGATVVLNAPVGAPHQEGPVFDGLRLLLNDCNPPRISEDSTRWISGGSTLVPDVSLPSFDPGTGLITGIPYVSDYIIQLFDHTVDTSSSLYGWPPALMNFSVWNRTESHRVEVLFTDLNGDRTIGQYDDLILIERDSLKSPFPTWELFFSGTSNPTLPSPGDIFLFKLLKPFTGMDVYEFRALPSGIVAVHSPAALAAFRLEQNFPNPFNPSTVVRYQVPSAGEVKLVVYDILGREVAVLVNETKVPGSYEVLFQARGLSSGVYFTRLAAGGSTQTRKMLLVR